MHGQPVEDPYLAACRRVLLETVGVGLYFVMRPRRRAHGMCLLYTCYVCCVDAGSGYGRLYPAHHMTALVAAGALESYSAELA